VSLELAMLERSRSRVSSRDAVCRSPTLGLAADAKLLPSSLSLPSILRCFTRLLDLSLPRLDMCATSTFTFDLVAFSYSSGKNSKLLDDCDSAAAWHVVALKPHVTCITRP
jgi:hypothetical protein